MTPYPRHRSNHSPQGCRRWIQCHYITLQIGDVKKVLKPYDFRTFGGDKRDRTADLLNAIQALSQLSYTPI